MSLAQEMWDYLKSIGFKYIPNNDERLGCQIGWTMQYIARDNLCAYTLHLLNEDICLIDVNNYNINCGVSTKDDLKIRSVADLEAWLRKEYSEFFTVEQHQYKVGDKVRILEDAIVYEGAGVVQEYGALTAVGEIGVVDYLWDSGNVNVKDLPTECGGGWTYEPHQIEPYIEEFSMESSNEVEHHYIGIIPEKVTNKERSNDSIESTTSEDALVINKDITPDNFHKVWEYNNGTKQWGNGFVTTIAEEGRWAASIYNGDNLYTSDFYGDYLPFILRRVPLKPLPKEVANRESDTIVATQSITSEDAPTQAAINKDNIEAVLEYNGIKDFRRDEYEDLFLSFDCNGCYTSMVSLKNPNLIRIIEAHYGRKLEPLPDEEIVLAVGDKIKCMIAGITSIQSFDYNTKNIVCSNIEISFESLDNGFIKSVNGKKGKFVIPPFNFEQALLNAGFKQVNDILYAGDYLMESGLWFNSGCDECNTSLIIKRTPANAQILIELKTKFEKLELAQ